MYSRVQKKHGGSLGSGLFVKETSPGRRNLTQENVCVREKLVRPHGGEVVREGRGKR